MKAKELLVSAGSLLLAGLILVVAGNAVAPAAAANAAAEQQEMMETLLPGSTVFTPEEDTGTDANITAVWKGEGGWIIETTVDGYAGPIRQWTGVDSNGHVTGLVVRDMEETFGLAGSLSPEQVAQALEDHPGVKLVVYPSPTYDGVVSDTAGICAAAHAKGVPVLVDEAHGALLGFHPAFPPGAMAQGADLAVASLHKMLPSLTQTALLHAGGKLVPLPQVARQTGIFQSSSPSYLLMASMDGCVRLLEEKGEALFAAWHRRLTEFDQGIQGLRHLRGLGHGREAGAHYPGIFALDPAKILISTQGTGLTGVALRDLLRREYRIEVEMALDHYVLAMTGLGTDDAMPARLAQALLAIDETCASSEETPSVLTVPGALPPRRCSLEEAAQAPGGLSFLYDAMGKVCGEYIWAYPPGIPLIAPGEEITPPLVETVEGLYRAGVRLIGTRGKPPFTTFALGDQDG